MNRLKLIFYFLCNLLIKFRRRMKIMTCFKDVTQRLESALPSTAPITEQEKDLIKYLCESGYFPWYEIFEIIFNEKTRRLVVARIKNLIGNLTDPELEWIHAALKKSNCIADDLSSEISKARSSKASLPEPSTLKSKFK